MPENQTYKNWKAVTEADFVSLFIKTWFAYISTLRIMFPEAYNRRGDKKYLNAFKDYYKRNSAKYSVVNDSLNNSIAQLYCDGRKIIMEKYPEFYLWDFYRVNEDFKYTFKDVPPDKSDSLIIMLKLVRNRGTVHNFSINGFVEMFGKYYTSNYNYHIKFEVNISSILKDSTSFVQEHPDISEQDYLSWILDQIYDALLTRIMADFQDVFSAMEHDHGKRMLARGNDIAKRTIAAVRRVFALNGKDETFKTTDEMLLSRGTYEIIQQRPRNYYQYHMDVDWVPQRELTASEARWYLQLHRDTVHNSVIWFLDFVYRLRNALFHEIIDPLDEEWQTIFKHAYLVLKEIVDLNIRVLEKT